VYVRAVWPYVRRGHRRRCFAPLCFNGNLSVYDLEAGEATCEGLKQVLEANKGKSLASIGRSSKPQRKPPS
jgi:hypothetical protein